MVEFLLGGDVHKELEKGPFVRNLAQGGSRDVGKPAQSDHAAIVSTLLLDGGPALGITIRETSLLLYRSSEPCLPCRLRT